MVEILTAMQHLRYVRRGRNGRTNLVSIEKKERWPKASGANSTSQHLVDPKRFQEIDLDQEASWWTQLPLQGFKIGSVEIPNRYVLAPMCDVTNLPYRILARAHGSSLLATEMLSSVAMVMQSSKTFQMMEFLPEEEPIMVQISGTDPDVMLRASVAIQEYGATMVNLNCGCPVKKVIKGGSGSALLKSPEVLRTILKTLRPELDIPLTVKMRAGWDAHSVNAVEISKMCEDEGVDAVMLHGRTRSQMYEGNANWDLIAKVKESVSIPVIGNGDIFCGDDAHKMLEQTGCDAVMIGRGAIGNPWIFRECVLQELGIRQRKKTVSDSHSDHWDAPSYAELHETILRHFELFSAYAGQSRALRQLRKQIMAYVKGIPGASAFRGNLAKFTSEEALKGHLSDFFDGAIERQRCAEDRQVDRTEGCS